MAIPITDKQINCIFGVKHKKMISLDIRQHNYVKVPV